MTKCYNIPLPIPDLHKINKHQDKAQQEQKSCSRKSSMPSVFLQTCHVSSPSSSSGWNYEYRNKQHGKPSSFLWISTPDLVPRAVWILRSWNCIKKLFEKRSNVHYVKYLRGVRYRAVSVCQTHSDLSWAREDWSGNRGGDGRLQCDWGCLGNRSNPRLQV